MNVSISEKSRKAFIGVNGLLLSLSAIQYFATQHALHDNYVVYFFHLFAIFLARNYYLLFAIDYLSKHKPDITDNLMLLPKEEYKYEFTCNLLSSTAVETVSHALIKSNFTFIVNEWYVDLLYFIPISFLFELIFDFFHYTSHRLLHHKYVYKYFHKKHHKFNHPRIMVTYYHNPVDLLLTNVLPFCLTLSIMNNMFYISYFQLNTIIVYKTFGEICGHLGKSSYPTSSFCQFMWIPKYFHFELYTDDHDLHHSLSNCNYSKRFSLWDKVFGTFVSAKYNNME